MSIPPKLIEELAQGRVVPFVGSGVSLAVRVNGAAVFPSWGGLLKDMADSLNAAGNDDDAAIVRSHCNKGRWLKAAEAALEGLNKAGFYEVLRNRIDIPMPDDADWSLPDAVWSLQPPIVVTTNYDSVLTWRKSEARRMLNDQPAELAQLYRAAEPNRPTVWHLHGHIERADSLILAPLQYEAFYDDAEQMRRQYRAAMDQLRALLTNWTLLFIGFGMQDEYVMKLVTDALDAYGGATESHFALMKEGEADIEQLWKSHNVQVIEYPDHGPPLVALLDELAVGVTSATLRPHGKGNKTRRRALAAVPETVTAYLKRLTEETATLTMLGMGRSLQVELPIAEAYVPLQTTIARSMDERKTDRYNEAHAEYHEDIDLGEVFRKATEFDQRGIILLGEPGSGKTTGARQLTWKLASHQSRPEELGLPLGMTPVLLRFRNLSRQALAEKNGLRRFLDEETHCPEAPDDCQSPGEALWNGKAGPLLWILDGLDEVVDPQARQKVSGWIQRAIKSRPDDWFLVTCRFAGYFRKGVPLGARFVEFHVRPLDDQQIQRFVRDWFAAAYDQLHGRGSRATERATADSKALLDILARPDYQAGHIRELSTNPLLLTILCIVFHEERKLPTGRAELYAHCVRVLLEYWRQDVYDSELGTQLAPYDAEAAQAVLACVAWWMHQQQDRTAAPLDELAEQAEAALAQVSPSSGLGRDGHAFIERMRDEAGILAMEGEGNCGFLHLSFQEYLAAEHAARENLAKELASVATESWWREAALLSLRRSRPFCEAFFREMLAAGIAEDHPDLAERCLTEALYFVPGPFVKVLEKKSPKSDKARSVHDARVRAVLRLLKDRADQVPELEAISRRLAQSEDRDTRSFAQEILAHRGITPVAATEEEGVFVDPKTGIAFVRIPAGEFRMGSDNGLDWEKPIHLVRITHDFMLGKYPVTNAQYRQFMEASKGKIGKPQYWDDRRFNQTEQPVVGISWPEALAFCQWAGGRLPTEAEWEYACRAGTTTEYSFGDDAKLLGEYAWYNENSGNQTQPVGSKKPNPWGLYDMHGNVLEWCADWFEQNYYARSPEVDPPGPEQAAYRVIRGGGWAVDARCCRSADRDGYEPEYRDYDLGFRVAAVPPSQQDKKQEPMSGAGHVGRPAAT